MPYFVLYTALLLLGFFFFGAWLACAMRRMFGSDVHPALQTAGVGTLAGAGVAATAGDELLSDAGSAANNVISERTGSGLFGDREPVEQAVQTREALQDDPVGGAESAAETRAEPDQVRTVSGDALEESESGAVTVSEEPASVVAKAIQGEGDDASDGAAPASEAPSGDVDDIGDREDTAPVEDEPRDVASAVAAASAAAAAAVAAAKANVASAEGMASAPDPAPAPAVAEAAQEEILPSPESEGFQLPEAELQPVAEVLEFTTDGDADVPAAEFDTGPSAERDDAASEHETIETELREDTSVLESAGTMAASAAAATGLAAVAGADDNRDEQRNVAATSEDEPEEAAVEIGAPAEETDEDEATVASLSVAARADGPAEDLLRIKGIDADTQTFLNGVGIRRYEQVADLRASDIAHLQDQLGAPARISREGWVEQATILKSGGETYFTRRHYGKSTGETPASSSATETSRADASGSPAAVMTAAAAVGGVAGAAVSVALPEAASETDPQPDTHVLSEAPVQSESTGGSDAISSFMASRGEREPREEWEPRAEREPRPDREPRAERDARFPHDAAAASSAASEPTVAGTLDDTGGETVVAEEIPVLDGDQDQSDQSPEPGATRRAPTEGLLSTAQSRVVGTRQGRSIPGVGNPERRRVVGGGQMLQSSTADDLKRIRGVGVVIEKKLNAMGVHSYAQIAAWTEEDIQKVNGILDFSGRIERENWIEQARVLANTA